MRTVRLQPDATASLDAAIAKFPRFDEVYRGLEWLLANDPDAQGIERGGSAVCLGHSEWGSVPGIMAVFTHNDETVTIHGIKAIVGLRS